MHYFSFVIDSVGKNDITKKETNQAIYKIKEVKFHPKAMLSKEFNIALLRVDGRIALNQNVQPITLPERDILNDDKCMMSGNLKLNTLR